LILLVSVLTLFFFSFHQFTYNQKKTFTPVYTNDWFDGNTALWAELLKDVKGKENLKYLEIGVAEGKSAFWMLENILTHPKSQATLVDPFFRNYRKVFFSNYESYPYKSKIIIKEGLSEVVLRKLPLNHYNIIYIDGSHNGINVFYDLANSWQLLKVGGLLIIDDKQWKEKELPIQLRPEQTVNAFLNVFSDEFEIVHKEYQVWVKKLSKPKESSSRFTRLNECFYDWMRKGLFSLNGESIELKAENMDTLESLLIKNHSFESRSALILKDPKLTRVRSHCFSS
jgi:predicted O-methyltransferase YrrM